MTPEDAIHLLHKAGCPPDVIAHAQAVAEYAREIAVRYNERHRNHADIELVIAGALLHDIGRARSNGIDHAVVGAEIAQAFGLDTRIVRIIKRHIGAGIPKEEAERLGLPEEDYLPETAEEMIVAHADNLVDDTEIDMRFQSRRVTLGMERSGRRAMCDQKRISTADRHIILYRAGHLNSSRIGEVIDRIVDILRNESRKRRSHSKKRDESDGIGQLHS